VDETPIKYLAPGHGRTKQGYLWTCAHPEGDTVFHWATSRAAACLEAIIPVDFRGTLQCDGYSAYPAFARQHNARAGGPALRLAGCWAHARRALYEARESAPRTAGWLLRQIGLLYQIEEQLRQQRAGANLRQAVRAAQSAMILRRIKKTLERIRPRYLPQSGMGTAISYTLEQWSQLEVFVRHGQIAIDNNRVENAIRPTAVGKRNWLFVGEAEAGHRSAVLYTIVESCRRRGLDPIAYLREVLTRLPAMTINQVHELTPQAWAKAQRHCPSTALAS
jgi:hypothetical protein